jgi:hypothetical protein
MKTKLSPAYQRQCVEHLLAYVESQASDMSATVREGCRQAVLSLAWIERRQELLRALDHLERQRPDLVDLFRVFPEATISDVREKHDNFCNGSGCE